MEQAFLCLCVCEREGERIVTRLSVWRFLKSKQMLLHEGDFNFLKLEVTTEVIQLLCLEGIKGENVGYS